MARTISVYRRKNDLIDLWLPKRDGLKSFDFKKATNFDGVFSTFQVVPADGFSSTSAANNHGFEVSQFREKTRFRFAPSDYSISDIDPLWVLVSPNLWDGSSGPDEAVHMIYPVLQGRSPIILNGTAPNEASLASSLEINLQTHCQNFTIVNSDAVSLFVAFAPGGAEFEILPSSTPYSFSNVIPSASQIFVRGNGATADFSLMCSVRNEAIS